MAAGKGPGGKEIGRVSVRVVPDTTGFRNRAQGELESETQGLEADADLKLGDTSEFRARAKAATEGLSADVALKADTKSLDLVQKQFLTNAQSAMKKIASKVTYTPDGERMFRQSQKAFKALESEIKADIPVDVHLAAGQRAKVFGELEAMQAFANANPLEIKLKVDEQKSYKIQQATAKLREKAIEEEAKAEKSWSEKLAKLHEGLQNQKHKQRIADFREELRVMKMHADESNAFVKNFTKDGAGLGEVFRPHQRLEVDLDVRREMFRGFSGRLSRMFDGLGQKLGDTLVGGLRSGVDKSAAKPIGGGLLNKLLPSFGSGINFGGYALMFAGIMDVAAPLIGMLTTAFLSLPGLISLVGAPIAAVTLGLDGFKKAAEKIKPQFDGLRQTMSDVAESEFTPVLERVANTVFPMLERSLPGVTAGLRNMADGVVDAINNPDNKLEGTIRNIGAALTAAKPGVDGFVSAFLQLANQLSLKFPAIISWFNDAGTRFDAWVAKVSADGTLSSAFDGLGESLKIILDTVTELGGKSIDFLKNPENLQMFKEQLQGIGNLLKEMVSWSASLNENFQNLKQLARPVAAIGAVMQGDFDGAWSNTRDFFKYFAEDGEKAGTEAGTRTAQSFNDSMKTMLMGGGNAVAPGSLDELFKGATGQQVPGQAPEIQPPNLEPAKTEITQYQSFVDQVTAQVRGALQQATSGESLPAPNFEAFKAAWAELPTFVTSQISSIQQAAVSMGTLIGGALSSVTSAAAPVWDGLKIQAVTAFNQIATEAAALPGKIGAALGSLNGIGQTAGAALMSGLLAGMQGSEGMVLGYAGTLAGKIAAVKGPLPYDRKVLQPNGEALMEGLMTGMTTGFEPVLEKAKSMAQQIAEAMDNGSSLTNLLGGKKFPELTKMLDELETQRKAMKVELDATTDKGAKQALRDKMAQLQTQKDALSLQKQELTNAQKYGGELADQVGTTDEWASKFMDVGVNFARATGDQAMSDLGIGGGAITGLGNALLDYGVQMAKKGVTNIYTTSMDDALAAKQRTDNRAAMQWEK